MSEPSASRITRGAQSRPGGSQSTSSRNIWDSRNMSTPENNIPTPESKPAGKRRRHRGPRRRRRRRHSFALSPPLGSDQEEGSGEFSRLLSPPNIDNSVAGGGTGGAAGAGEGAGTGTGGVPTVTCPKEPRRATLYGLGANLSGTSLDSQELLDHRKQPMIRTRRESRLGPRPDFSTLQHPSRLSKTFRSASDSEDENSDEADDRTPLMKPGSVRHSHFIRYGAEGGFTQSSQAVSPGSTPHLPPGPGYDIEGGWSSRRDYDVNNPPSVPGSPRTGPEIGYDDAVLTGHNFELSRSPGTRSISSRPRDAVIDIDESPRLPDTGQATGASPPSTGLTRRRTVTLPVEEDVCFPTGGLSDLAEEDFVSQAPPEGDSEEIGPRRRRRRRAWPDLSVLEEWSREEKEERSGGARAKTVSEPVLIGGRLRIRNATWTFEEEDAPYRFTYFNEEFPSTIHSQTISELPQPGQTFRDLFIPEPPVLSDSSDDEDEDEFDWNFRMNSNSTYNHDRHLHLPPSRSPNHAGANGSAALPAAATGGGFGGVSPKTCAPKPKEKRYGPRPTFWLDVLCPTDTEMRVLAKAFGIHALTVEDIMMQEAREKVELFRNYYFINYTTFEQDINNPKFLEPVNMYVVVFREGLLSFHFSMTPHPANVRRRIRQLKDYLILSADWISYAIIDDVTDVFGPLIQSIEDEVDTIDDTILRLHSDPKYLVTSSKEDEAGQGALDSAPSGSDMLRRVGECRKKVMGLYRLLGNKADVIKGFAKRCNEQWEVAPKSEIGLYLGDIQDHILTMTSNLTHYETLLSRAHSNYLALINIRMNERQELTADVLGKLTVLGTIVLPMNIICGMWGMNVKVPGQEQDSLLWFWSITAGLVGFAVVCFYVAKRVYGIV